jgi:hypothetical protein
MLTFVFLVVIFKLAPGRFWLGELGLEVQLGDCNEVWELLEERSRAKPDRRWRKAGRWAMCNVLTSPPLHCNFSALHVDWQ